MHRQTDGQMGILMGQSNLQQLNWLVGATNHPPLININKSVLTIQWLIICYLVLSSDRLKLSRFPIAQIITTTMTRKLNTINNMASKFTVKMVPMIEVDPY